jgi:hypothetical protein
MGGQGTDAARTGIGLALAGVLVGYLFWRERAALSPAAAVHP